MKPHPDYDTKAEAPAIRSVIVIGAGISGLAAARTLSQRGLRVVVVEARDRVGGRCHTVDGIDLGAHWIHGTEGNPVIDLVNSLSMPTVFSGGDSTYSGGWDRLKMVGPQGMPLGPDEMVRSILQADGFYDAMEDLRAAQVSNGEPDISIREAARRLLEVDQGQGVDRQALEWHLSLWTRDDVGATADSLSFQNCDEGYEVYGYGDSSPLEGYGTLASRLAEGLVIRLHQVVREVHWSPSRLGVRVVTDRASFEADAALVTLPLGVLKTRSVRFDPPLSPSRQTAVDRLGFGNLAKVALVFSQPFWSRDQYVFGYGARPASEGWPTSVINLWKSHRIPALVLLLGGEQGRQLEAGGLSAAREWAMNVLRDIFGDVLPEPAAVHLTGWSQDPYAHGGYSFIQVGSSQADIEALGRPEADSLVFAGEATCAQHWATVHGAYVSGLTASAQILRDPRVLPPRRFTESRRWRKMMMRSSRFIAAAEESVDSEEIQARTALLGQSEVFSRLREEELKTLASLFKPVEIAAGTELFALDEPACEVFVVASGDIEVHIRNGERHSMSRSAVIGEYGMFGEGRRSGRALARTDAKLLSLDYKVFRRFLLTFPEAMMALFELSVSRLMESRVAASRVEQPSKV